MKYPISKIMITLVLFFIISAEQFGCTDSSHANGVPQPESRRAVAIDDGNTITFPPGSTGLSRIEVITAKKGSALISVIAPARVVASVLTDGNADGRTVMFDSPDLTSLYSQYRQSKSNVDLTTKNLGRIKDMYESHAATAKDLNQAETEAANARAARAEFESKLRASGFDPPELDSVRVGTIWIISDVPETQLNEVQKGEDVDVFFSSFPERKFIGRAEAIGDIIDPVTRTVKVRVSLPNPQKRFLPGMFARVDFGDPINEVIILPASVIVTVEGKDYVFVQTRDGEFRRRQVTTANPTGSEVVVLKGLEGGEKVVSGGAMLLKGLSFGY